MDDLDEIPNQLTMDHLNWSSSDSNISSEFCSFCVDAIISSTFNSNFSNREQILRDGQTQATWNTKPWPLLKQPIYAATLLSIAYILVALVGVVSNTLVMMVIWCQPNMRSPTNYFLANLAVADILVCVFVLPITLLQNVFTEWWYGPVICKLAPYLQGVAVSASVNTLGAVAIERYSVVFFPHTTKMSPRTAAIAVFFIWCIPLGMFIPWILVYEEKTFHLHIRRFEYVACHADWKSYEMNKAFTLGVVFLTCYLIPLVCIGIFYILIGVRIWKRQVFGIAGSQAANNLIRSKKRILRMLIVVLLLFTFSWLPLYCINIRMLFSGSEMSQEEKNLMKNYIAPMVQWLGASNSCVNPFVYCYFSYNFRKGIADLIQRIKRRAS